MDLSNAADLSCLTNGGQFISASINRVAEAISEYSNGELITQWIPPGERVGNDAAFRIIHAPVGRAPYIAFVVQTEAEFDERILKKVMANDQRGGKRTMSELEAFDASHKLIAKKKRQDQMDEANDIAYHVLRSHKNTYKVNDKLTFKEHGPQMFTV